ncbi:MAG: T9SS type A sorting domain-containing protein [Bacteroidota bacterium]
MENDFLFIGNSSEPGATNQKIFMIKTNPVGDIIWTKSFVAGNGCHSSSIVLDEDSGFTVVGSINHGLSENVLLFKTNSSGDILWSKEFVGESAGISLKKTADGGNIILGNKYDIWTIYVIKTDSNGNSGCNENDPGVLLSNKSFQIYNVFSGSSFGYQVYQPIVNTGYQPITSTTLCLSDGIKNTTMNILFTLSPNPVSSTLAIATNQSLIKIVDIFNVLGENIKYLEFMDGKSDIEINVSSLDAGIYFVKVETENGSSVQKLLKQ